MNTPAIWGRIVSLLLLFAILEIVANSIGCAHVRMVGALSCVIRYDKAYLLRYFEPTLMRLLLEAVAGLTLTAAISYALAIIGLYNRGTDRITHSVSITSQVIPFWVFTLLLNYNARVSATLTVIVTAAIFAFFPVYSVYRDSLIAVPVDVDDVLRIANLSHIRRTVFVEAIRALPAFFTGLKLSTPYVVSGALLGEALVFDWTSERGTVFAGKLLDSAARLGTAESASRITLFICVALFCTAILYAIISLLDSTICRWHYLEITGDE